MQTARCFVAAIAAVLLVLVGCPARAAAADVRIPMGGGAGIVINGDTMCTLTTIGGDAAGELIGFTSAHCGGPGAQVAAEGAENAGVLGTMVAGNDNLDYAVIKFDPAKVTPTANYNGFAINGLGGSGLRRDRLQAGPDHRKLVRRHLGPGQTRAPSSCRSAGSRVTRGAGDRQQHAGRHDPRGVQRQPADLRHQVHPAAHAGRGAVVQRDPGRRQRQAPARCGFTPLPA